MTRNKTANIFIGFSIFAASLLMLIFLPKLLPQELGLYGSSAIELLLLLFALAVPLLFKGRHSEIFPLRRVKGRDAAGGILLWMATFCIALFASSLLITLFPGMREVSESINSTVTENPFWLSFLAVAVLPAICEEMLTRGVMQYCFKSGGKVFCIVATGILFGIMHLDIYRLLSTALLGICFAYIVYKTGSLLIPMLCHFFNNLFAVIAAYASTYANSLIDTPVTGASVDAFANPSLLIGAGLIYLAPGVILLNVALRLLAAAPSSEDERKKRNTVTALCGGASVALSTVGIFIIITSALSVGI